MSAARRAARRASDRAVETRRRWRRATGAIPLEHAQRRIEMAAVSVDEEVGLMHEVDHDLAELEQVVLGVARRRLDAAGSRSGTSTADSGTSDESPGKA